MNKAESQETPGVTGKFGLGVQNEAGKKLIEFSQENALVIANSTGHSKHPLPNTREDSTHRHHQMVNTKIRLIIFFRSNTEKLYTVSKNKTSS